MRKHVLQDGKGQKKGSKDKEVKKNQRWMFFFNILYIDCGSKVEPVNGI